MGSVPHDEHVAPSPKAFTVAIIGGGIGGLALALGLLKHDHVDVQIYESAHAFGEIGAGITVGPNAQRALELIGPGPSEAFKRLATGNLWQSHANNYTQNVMGWGEHEGQWIADQKNRTGMQCVHRARFLEGFIELIPPQTAHFKKRLIKIEEHGEGTPMILHFKDGTTATADAVIGADGIHSTVRALLLGADHPATKPVFTGTASYRGMVTMDQAREKLGDEYAENSMMLVGPNRAFLSYPIDRHETLNIVFMDYDVKSWESDKWIVPKEKAEVERLIEGWGEKAHALVDLMATGDLAAWAMFDSPPAPYYNKGAVVMMGDAAHATTPYQGQGAAQAIEDALVLETLLGEVKNKDHIPQALAAFDQVRRPRTQRMVSTSRESGDLLGLKAPGIGDDIPKMRQKMVTRMHWLWNRDLGAQNRAAIRLFKEAL